MTGCPRILCENRVPGRIGSADGPVTETHRPCELDAGHLGAHLWGEPIIMRASDMVR